MSEFDTVSVTASAADQARARHKLARNFLWSRRISESTGRPPDPSVRSRDRANADEHGQTRAIAAKLLAAKSLAGEVNQ